MNTSSASSPAHRAVKSGCLSSQPNGGHESGTDGRGGETQNAHGAQIAQTAIQSVGMSTRNFGGPFTSPPEYAAAVSIIFTKATNQAIMLGTEPRHVLSPSLLCNSLLHDKRFKRLPMSEAAPGDIVIEPGGNQAHGYAGIVVDHGRIVSMGTPGTVQNNTSLLEIQHHRQEMAIFRYIGVQGHRNNPLANAGFKSDEPRLPSGQPGGGQWTGGGAGGLQRAGGLAEMAPSTTVLSGRNSLLSDEHGRQNTGQKDVRRSFERSDSPGDARETSDSLLAQVSQALKEGREHPTPAQLEKIGEACDAWQRYAVNQGVPQNLAGLLIQDFVHTYYSGESNSGAEGIYDFQQGEPSGSAAAGIVAGAIVAISHIPAKESAGTLPDAGGPGAAKGLTYEPNPKHPAAGSILPGEGNIAPEPTDPQQALNTSVPFSSNSSGRVAVDPKAGEFVVFKQHGPGRFHGYAVRWEQLTQSQKNALIKTGQVNMRGKIL